MAETARWESRGSLRFLRLHGLEAAAPVRSIFTGRHGGVSALPFTGSPGGLNLSYSVGDVPEQVAENRRQAGSLIGATLDRTVVAGLVHGVEAARVNGGPYPDSGRVAAGDASGLITGVDALVTDQPGLALLVTCADCAPIYLVDPRRRAIGLAHAGWRGTAGGIGAAAVQAMAHHFGSRPQDLQAVVGPCIGPCCYEVDEPVAKAMQAHPDGRYWLRPGRPGHYQLNLWQANRDQLVRAGLLRDRVACAVVCTSCHVQDLFSHRAESGRAGRQAALLMIEPDAPGGNA